MKKILITVLSALVTLSLTACDEKLVEPKEHKNKVIVEKTKQQYTVYRSDVNGENLIEDKITINQKQNEESDTVENKVELLFQLLKSEPNPNRTDELSGTIPENVELLDVKLKDKTVYLNFNEKAMELNGSTGQMLFMDSLVQTIFTNMSEETVENIKFQINGQDTDLLSEMSVKGGISRN